LLLVRVLAVGNASCLGRHDDHYFHVADRIIKLDYGQLEFDHRVGELVAASEALPTVAGGAVQA
jgi:ABC-type siderophore export system fused ATPase/permease subunit